MPTYAKGDRNPCGVFQETQDWYGKGGIGIKISVLRKLLKDGLLPELPDWKLPNASEPMLIYGGMDWFLRAVNFADSRWSERLAPVVVTFPLYRPHHAAGVQGLVPLVGNFSTQLINRTSRVPGWDIPRSGETDLASEILASIKDQAPSFFAATGTPRALLEYIDSRGLDEGDDPILETKAYSYVLAGDDARARDTLEQMERVMALYGGPADDIDKSRLGRAKLIRDALRRGHDEAVWILRGWRDASLRALNLERFV